MLAVVPSGCLTVVTVLLVFAYSLIWFGHLASRCGLVVSNCFNNLCSSDCKAAQTCSIVALICLIKLPALALLTVV